MLTPTHPHPHPHPACLQNEAGYTDLFIASLIGTLLMLIIRAVMLYANSDDIDTPTWGSWIRCQLFRAWYIIEPKSGQALLEAYSYRNESRKDRLGNAVRAQRRVREFRAEMWTEIFMVLFEDCVEICVQIMFI